MVLPFQNFQRFYAVKSQAEFGENENLDQDSNSKPSENMISKANRLNVRNEIDLYEMYHSLDQLFTSVSSLMATDIRISELALCIGDSVHFAKEIFTLNMNDLNIIDHRLDTEERNLKNSKLPTLSVRYLIQTFYKKLLNNIIPELEKQFGGASSKSKNCPDKNNVILAVKINQSQLVQFQTELDRLQVSCVSWPSYIMKTSILLANHRFGQCLINSKTSVRDFQCFRLWIQVSSQYYKLFHASWIGNDQENNIHIPLHTRRVL